MSYLALARKWRPIKFDQLIGQEHVITALENALKQDRLHHAYLFSGTRGVGKTSIGRLFAKGLNCETGITNNPCGKCSTCLEIDQGRYVDLLEIDAASRTKVEDTRELLDNVQYKPARGRFKVYLIDEVHMLSRHSFNALLKTLEEPPEYVKFILATTDPQKLPITILSRCLHFHLKPISVEAIRGQLEYVLSEEKITSETRALSLIAHSADGSMRDALSLSDQAIALGNGHIDSKTVSDMLGTVDTDQAILLLQAISAKQANTIMDCIDSLAENGVDWDGLITEIGSQLHRIAMYQALPASLDKDQPDAERIVLLSQALTPQDIQLYYQITIKGRQDLPFAPNAKMAVEMLLLRMLAFRPASEGLNPISVESSSMMTVPVVEPASRPQVDHQQTGHQQADHQQRGRQPVSHQPAMNNQASANSYNGSLQGQAQPNQSENDPHQRQYQQQNQSQYQERQNPPQNDVASNGQSRTNQSSGMPNSNTSPTVDRQDSPAKTSSSPLTNLRHQLRSKRDSLRNETDGGNTTKKPDAVSAANSVLERIASQPASSAAQAVQSAPISSNGTPMSGMDLMQSNANQPHPSRNNPPSADEPYQWKSTQIEDAGATNDTQLVPSKIKKALEHEKTPEMAQKLIDEVASKDQWSAMIQTFNTAKLVEQLALNSSFSVNNGKVALTLREQQVHLNGDKAQEALTEALTQYFQKDQQLQQALHIESVEGQACELTICIGNDGVTPLELREQLYQAKLQQASKNLENDPNVQFLQKRFMAEIEPDSIRPI